MNASDSTNVRLLRTLIAELKPVADATNRSIAGFLDLLVRQAIQQITGSEAPIVLPLIIETRQVLGKPAAPLTASDARFEELGARIDDVTARLERLFPTIPSLRVAEDAPSYGRPIRRKKP